MRFVLVPTLFWSLVVSCSDMNSDLPPITRDSSGVGIIEYSSQDGKRWELSDQPLLDIDAEAGLSGEFFRVSDAIFLANGDVAVVNAGSQQIRIFDSEANLKAEFGRSGQGPGEFVSPFQIFEIPPDRIVVSDPFQARISIFDLSGTLIDDAPTPSLGGLAMLAGWLVGDTVITAHFTTRPPPNGFSPQFMQYTYFSWTTGAIDSVAQVPSGSIGFVGGGEPWGIVRGALFEPIAQAITVNNLLVVGDAGIPELRFYDGRHSLRRILRWDEPTLEVTSEDIEAFRETRLDQMDGAERRKRREKQLDATPVSEDFPHFGRLRVDNDGRFWVEEYVKPQDDVRTWHVFDMKDRFRYSLQVSMRTKVFDAMEDLVLLVEQDELDVEHVHVYRLLPS